MRMVWVLSHLIHHRYQRPAYQHSSMYPPHPRHHHHPPLIAQLHPIIYRPKIKNVFLSRASSPPLVACYQNSSQASCRQLLLPHHLIMQFSRHLPPLYLCQAMQRHQLFSVCHLLLLTTCHSRLAACSTERTPSSSHLLFLVLSCKRLRRILK